MIDIKTYLSEEQIKKRVKEIGMQISKDYQGKELVLIGILRGSFIFLADLCRSITVKHSIDFLGVSSYGVSTSTSGVVQITRDLQESIEGKHAIIVEDIIDTGLTMDYLLKFFKTRNPLSIKVCSFLFKPSRNVMKPPIHYLGFEIENRFVIGYGMDYENEYRNLPYIGFLEQENQ